MFPIFPKYVCRNKWKKEGKQEICPHWAFLIQLKQREPTDGMKLNALIHTSRGAKRKTDPIFKGRLAHIALIVIHQFHKLSFSLLI